MGIREHTKKALRQVAGRFGYDVVKTTLRMGKEAVRRTRDSGRQWLYFSRPASGSVELNRLGSVYYVTEGPSLDRELCKTNFVWVTAALDAAHINWWWVDGIGAKARRIIGVAEADRKQTLQALVAAAQADAAGAAVRAAAVTGRNPHFPLNNERSLSQWQEVQILRVARFSYSAESNRTRGLKFGCDIEFWRFDPDGMATAPRENRAAASLDPASAELTFAKRHGEEVRLPVVFNDTMLEDITFDIDVVYTWVDGDDPAWQRKKAEASPDAADAPALHSESTHEARFRSRDELLYSLRSLDDYAPWVRNVFIVTDSQVPHWLNTDNSRVRVIDHTEIFPDDGRLPVFNSNAIISRLHHIPGLSEHFIYINDDVMLGRPVSPQQFFLASGIALVSGSRNHRPFGPPSVSVEPHLNLTRNIRELLRDVTGRTVTRAIKHTPHPLTKSTMMELEELFAEAFDRTTRQKFRHHTDIVADQLHHYYALMQGRAAPSSLTYTYLTIRDDSYEPLMADLLMRRHRDSFCLNDAPVAGAKAISQDVVQDFMRSYFSAPSQFER